MHTLYFPSQVLGYSSDKANLVPPLKGIISVGDNQRNTNHFNYSEQWIFNSGIDYTGNEQLWRQQLIVKRTRRWSPLAWTTKGYSVIRVQGPKSPGRMLWSWLEAQRRGRCWPSPETTWVERAERGDISWLPSFFRPSTSTVLLSKPSKKPAGKRPGSAAYRWQSSDTKQNLLENHGEKQASVSTRAS